MQNQPRYQNITFNHFFVVVVAGTQMIAMFINILRTCPLLCTSTIFTFRSFPCQFLFMAGLPYVTTLILRILLNLLSSSWQIGNNWRRIFTNRPGKWQEVKKVASRISNNFICDKTFEQWTSKRTYYVSYLHIYIEYLPEMNIFRILI